MLKNRSGNLDSKSVVCLVVEYSKETRGGHFYSFEDNKVYVSTNAMFLEDNYISDHKPQSKIVLNELEPGKTSTLSIRVVDPQTSESQMIPDLDTLPPRRSRRVVIQPERYLDLDKEKWLKAMILNMESMFSNLVWDLVNLPDRVKPIRYKWIYKRKRGVDGKVETYKARLVAKGYTQKEGVDHEETFSPITMFKSIWILLSIDVYFIRQMDIKTAFLNDNLDESIYMMQPEGFMSSDQEQKVCKLQRHEVHLYKEQCPKTPQDIKDMRCVPYASAVGSLMYVTLCKRPDIYYVVRVVSRYQSNPGLDHWVAVKTILKYLRRTINYMLVYSGQDLFPLGYTNSDFQSDIDSRKFTSGSVFTLGGGAIVWRSIKQSCIADSTMEAEYAAACEAAKETCYG
ncbi:hypothetical protein JRO89_XS06G0170700 [Xanthoceras sorbifolium]|uniref:Gag/pol protein n=1 Tax=Xanthoceras sorbifolium TaxID=99658 RepID=A0ABQ8HYR0_9ROSI|nr:hypothetical protein JRO89_XS06G0170700 [Xanthoceras sorbifolium]